MEDWHEILDIGSPPSSIEKAAVGNAVAAFVPA